MAVAALACAREGLAEDDGAAPVPARLVAQEQAGAAARVRAVALGALACCLSPGQDRRDDDEGGAYGNRAPKARQHHLVEALHRGAPYILRASKGTRSGACPG